ncbi:MAG: type transport system ATP-binding protein [Patescibacteria group bacterium]|nr:type transport system ATP-binding protein [Patescibacteria group bacterium]MDQ5953911.1 type transport system ATP-binding protein [Patescibacteria group bacterium]
MNMVENIVQVNKLVKNYGKVKAVNGVSFKIIKGEVFGILGPNGAGKTTTLEMIEGIRQIDSGMAIVAGYDVKKQTNKVRGVIGVQPQAPAFQDKTTAQEVLELFAAAYGKKIDSLGLLAKVALTDKADTYTERLSGGQLQRLSIAAALVHQPQVLFMDEPTTGLDPQARRNIWSLVKSIQKQGITVVLTTHYMEEAEKLCDRVAIMDKGQIVTIDTPNNLIDALIKRGFKKKKQVSQASLEDVFIDLTGKELRD